jgi:hypothetical protein
MCKEKESSGGDENDLGFDLSCRFIDNDGSLGLMGTNGPQEVRNKFPNNKYLTSFGQDKGDQGTIFRDFLPR